MCDPPLWLGSHFAGLCILVVVSLDGVCQWIHRCRTEPVFGLFGIRIQLLDRQVKLLCMHMIQSTAWH